MTNTGQAEFLVARALSSAIDNSVRKLAVVRRLFEGILHPISDSSLQPKVVVARTIQFIELCKHLPVEYVRYGGQVATDLYIGTFVGHLKTIIVWHTVFLVLESAKNGLHGDKQPKLLLVHGSTHRVSPNMLT